MAKNVTVTLDTKILDRIIKHHGGNVAEAVAKTGFTVEGKAKIKVQQMEAIDTGALLSSIATSLQSGGNVRQAMAEASAKNPDAVTTPLPVPTDKHTAYVGPTVEYGLEVHMGTHRMAGRPFLLAAVREMEREFRERLGKAVTDGQ